VRRISHDLSDYLSVSPSADGHTIAAVQRNQSAELWVAPSNTPDNIRQITSGRLDGVGGVAFTPDGRIVYAANLPDVDVLNMSLTAGFAKNLKGAGPLVAALNKAVNYAGSQGKLVVSAAGNAAFDMDKDGNVTWVPAQSGSGLGILPRRCVRILCRSRGGRRFAGDGATLDHKARTPDCTGHRYSTRFGSGAHT
jgi:WD40 repeat protein